MVFKLGIEDSNIDETCAAYDSQSNPLDPGQFKAWFFDAYPQHRWFTKSFSDQPKAEDKEES